jgi:hypothetical protein
MTNGTIRSDRGTTIVIQYQDGSKTMSVPAHVPVVEVAPRPVTIATGQTVYAATDTLADGTITTDRILLLAPAAPANGK